MKNELLKNVWEDLVYLTNDWDFQDKSDANLRNLSTSLRRLLIDNGGTFLKAAKIICIKPRILGDNEPVSVLPNTVIHQTSGGKHKGLKITSFSISNRILSREEVKDLYMPKAKKRKPIKLTSFLKMSSIVIGGVNISREEIIKYVANKLGGNHFDPKRKKQFDDSGKLTLEGKYAILDEYRRKFKLADKDAVFFDLLSIGQRFIHSKDVQKVKTKIRTLLEERGVIEK